MSDFVENIRGKFYTVDEAKKYFTNYVIRNNGYLSDRFRKSDVQIINGRLADNSIALGNTSLEKNRIRLQPNQSIITFFHECRHLSDSWQAQDGKWYACWEYEKDYLRQMRWVDMENKILNVARGVQGKFMGEAVAELYATKMYWDMCGDKKSAQAYTAKRTTYDEEILTFKKICTVLDIDEDMLLNMTSEDDYARNFVRNQFEQITGDPRYWDWLEFHLDYVAMETFIKTAYRGCKVDDGSKKGFKMCRAKANEMISEALELSKTRGKITDREYAQRKAKLNELDTYMQRVRTLS